MSSRSDSSPAIHSTPVARGLVAPVKMPSPLTMFVPPRGGTNIVSGLGIFTGATNPRATGVLWMAGEESLLDDIQIHGFAGTFFPPAVSATLFGAARPGPEGGRGRWGAQHPS